MPGALELEGCMDIIIIKGPHFEETEKRVYQYLYKILSIKAKQMMIENEKKRMTIQQP
jgi:hypothetical protein